MNIKEIIIQLLKAKFQGVSDAILDRIATKLAKTVTTEEEANTAVEGVTFQQVLESYGDSRATEAQRTAIQNYETKHGLKDGKPTQQQQTPPSPPPPQKTEDMPDWAKALIDSNKTVMERLNAMDGDRVTAERKQKLSEIIQRLPENLRKGYDRISVDRLKDDEFNTLLSDVTLEVEGIVKDAGKKGAVFGMPPVGGQQPPKTLTEAQLKAITNRTGAPAEGQPF